MNIQDNLPTAEQTTRSEDNPSKCNILLIYMYVYIHTCMHIYNIYIYVVFILTSPSYSLILDLGAPSLVSQID